MAPTTQSPNVDNYFIGKGNVYFTELGGTERHLGNVPNFVMTPTLDTLEHFSSMGGVRSKDLEIILSQSITLAITLEEFTPANIGLALLGEVDEDAVGGPTVEIFSKTSLKGAIRFDGTNLYGAQMLVNLHNVSFTPQADVGLITDELGQIELEGAVSAAVGGANAGKFGTIQFKNVSPEAASAVTSIVPATGVAAGGTAVVINGSGFTDATGVTIGGVAATDFVVVSDSVINCTTGAHASGTATVVVLDAVGNGTLTNGFTYT